MFDRDKAIGTWNLICVAFAGIIFLIRKAGYITREAQQWPTTIILISMFIGWYFIYNNYSSPTKKESIDEKNKRLLREVKNE